MGDLIPLPVWLATWCCYLCLPGSCGGSSPCPTHWFALPLPSLTWLRWRLLLSFPSLPAGSSTTPCLRGGAWWWQFPLPTHPTGCVCGGGKILLLDQLPGQHNDNFCSSSSLFSTPLCHLVVWLPSFTSIALSHSYVQTQTTFFSLGELTPLLFWVLTLFCKPGKSPRSRRMSPLWMKAHSLLIHMSLGAALGIECIPICSQKCCILPYCKLQVYLAHYKTWTSYKLNFKIFSTILPC